MKNIFIFLVTAVLSTTIQAQEGFNYKAIITEDGSVLENVAVDVRFSILESDGTTELYIEKQNDIMTDENGIVSLYVGEGPASLGNFSTIDWSDNYYLKVEVETPTSAGYIDMGTAPLKPVPYAKYAENGGASEINELSDAISGGNSLFLGNGSGTGNSSGNNNNTGVGKNALKLVSTGTNNTAIGFDVLSSNTFGGFNIGIGNYSLKNHQIGDGNVAIGTHALESNSNGNDNLAIGNEAGYNCLGSGNIFIGNNAGWNETGSNKLYIDNTDTAFPLIGGDFESDEVTINGDIKVTQKLTAPHSGDADMKAYAYGEYYDGSSRCISDNVSITNDAEVGKYTINFGPDHSGTSNDYIVISNLYNDIGFVKIQKADDAFVIRTYNTSGVSQDKYFTFIVYKK